MKKVVIIIALIIIIAFLGVLSYSSQKSFRGELSWRNVVGFQIKEKAKTEQELKQELIEKMGGKTVVDEMFKNDPLFCLDAKDCAVQATRCCDEPINIYHYERTGFFQEVCFSLCSLTKGVVCENNRCKLIKDPDW